MFCTQGTAHNNLNSKNSRSFQGWSHTSAMPTLEAVYPELHSETPHLNNKTKQNKTPQVIQDVSPNPSWWKPGHMLETWSHSICSSQGGMNVGSVWNCGDHGRDFSEPHRAGLSPGSLSFTPSLPTPYLLLTVLAGVAGFTGGAAVPSSSKALTGAGEPGAGRQAGRRQAPDPGSPLPSLPPILQQEFILGSDQSTHMFSGLVSGQAQGWQSSGVPAVASP